MQVQGYIEPYGMQDKEGHFLNAYWKCANYASLDPITAAERTQLRVEAADSLVWVRGARSGSVGGERDCSIGECGCCSLGSRM